MGGGGGGGGIDGYGTSYSTPWGCHISIEKLDHIMQEKIETEGTSRLLWSSRMLLHLVI